VEAHPFARPIGDGEILVTCDVAVDHVDNLLRKSALHFIAKAQTGLLGVGVDRIDGNNLLLLYPRLLLLYLDI
jgi:hypothetical protein